MDIIENKISPTFGKIEYDEIEFGNPPQYISGKKIVVKKYIDLKSKGKIIKNFISQMQKDDEVTNEYYSAQYGLITDVLEQNTNINMADFDEDITKLDLLMASGLWETIKSKITNFNEVTLDISSVMEIYKYKNSAESNFNLLVKKLTQLIENVAKLDLNPQAIQELLAKFKAESDKVKEIVPVVKPVEAIGETPISEKKVRKSKKADSAE